MWSEPRRKAARRGSFHDGLLEGISRGEERGIAMGTAKGVARALLKILERRGLTIRDEHREQISECTDLAALDRLVDQALSAASVDELFLWNLDIEKFLSEPRLRMYKRAVADGMAKGALEGEARGLAKGRIRGAIRALLRILAQRGFVITELDQCQIRNCSDLATLESWIDRAPRVKSVDMLLDGQGNKGQQWMSQYRGLVCKRGVGDGMIGGITEGEARGAARGEARGVAEALLQLLEQRDLPVTGNQQRRICKCTDLSTLDRWLDRVLSVASVDELLK
jgi:hypothetical protein